MRAVGLKTLKNKLSEYIRLVKAGETVLVTDRDQVVAEIHTPQSTKKTFLEDAFLGGLVKEGLLTPIPYKNKTPPSRKPIFKFHTLLEELEDDRSER